MAAIVLGLCCVSSMLGGGYVAYNEMKKITVGGSGYTKTGNLRKNTRNSYVL